MHPVVTIIGGACLLTGSVFAMIGGLGLLRLPDFFSRIHGAGITDTMGAGLILTGLLFQAGVSLVGVKVVMILLLLWITGPASTHALAKSALASGLHPKLDEPEEASSIPQ